MTKNSALSAVNWASLLLLAVIAAFTFFLPVETGDIWWHLKAGQHIARTEMIPSVDPFPFAEEQTPWILTQWLGSLFYFLVHQSYGLLGLKVVRVLLLSISVGLLIRYSWRRLPRNIAILLGLILILAIEDRAHLRPHVFNFIYIQIFLISLFEFGRSGRIKSLLPMIPAGILWINIHLGSFMYGVTTIGLCLLASMVTWINPRSTHRPKVSQPLGYANALVVFLALFVFNPYGINGLLHPLKTLWLEEYIQFQHLSRTINELQPPVNLLSWTYAWVVPALIAGILGIIKDKRFQFRNILLLVFGVFMFTYGRRAGVFMALVCLYIFVDSYAVDQKSTKLPNGGFITVMTLILCILMASIGWQRQRQLIFTDGRIFRFHQLLTGQNAPHSIRDLLNNHKFAGRLFNDDIYGGYLMWHNYPGIRTFSDTRQINLKANQMYNAVLHDPQRFWPEMQQHIGFKGILLDANKLASRKALLFFSKNPNWELAMIDGDNVLFMKREYTHGLYVNHLKSQDQFIHDYQQRVETILNAGPIDRLRYSYMEPIASSITLFELGYKGAALEQLLLSFNAANTPYQHEAARHLLNHFNR